MSVLAELPLTRLSIHSLTVTPEGLASVTRLTALHELILQCPQVRLEELPAMAPLAQLVALDVSRIPLGKDGMERLRGLNRLQKLSVNSPEVDDRAISVLNGLKELQELELINSKLTDGGLSELSLPNLRKLSLAGCSRITDAGLEHLSRLGKLEVLDLVASGVAGRDLSPMGRIPGLRSILISAEQFKGDDDTVRALKKLLPECEVVIMRG
jgi:hypothetical protein